MKLTKKLAALIVALLMTAGIAACGTPGGTSESKPAGDSPAASAADTNAGTGEKTKIQAYLGGGDSVDAIQATVDAFNEQSGTTELELVPLPAGQSGYQILTVMYNAGNPPALFSLEAGDMKKVEDKLLELTDLPCIDKAVAGTLSDGTLGGKLYGVPYSRVEAFGLVYNRKVLDDVLGTDFDPASLTTLTKLKETFAAIESKGVAPIVLGPQDWSLANHFFSDVYTGQSEDYDERSSFIEALKNGEVDLADNEAFNKIMDTFDVFMEYNYYKDNPLEYSTDSSIDKQAQVLATGQAAFWFQGNWGSTTIRMVDEEGEYGMAPIPYGDDENAYPSGRITTLIPTYLCIENTVTSEAEQASAKEVIEFFVQSERGQELALLDFKGIPAYTNYTVEPVETLTKSIIPFQEAGKTKMQYMGLTSDHSRDVGVVMQKYLGGQIDRTELAAEVETYWQGQK